jgi:hypothetical protein
MQDPEAIAEDRMAFHLAVAREVDRINALPVSGPPPLEMKNCLLAQLKYSSELLEVAASPERRAKYELEVAGIKEKLARVEAQLATEALVVPPMTRGLYVELLGQITKKIGWKGWTANYEEKGMGRSTMFVYRSGKPVKEVDKIESTILEVAQKLGLTTRT